MGVVKHLILTADDFGRSPEINAAIERSHRAGFLTQASLMVNEPAVGEAVGVARRCTGLVVGLHLTLCAGRAARVSALTDDRGQLIAAPARAGFRYHFDAHLGLSLRDEIRAQFARFRALGFPPTYWDGHAHLHLHPKILRLTLPIAAEHGFRFTRLVREPGPPAPLPWIFQALSAVARPQLAAHGVRFADRVFGLRATGRMTTPTIARLLKTLPTGTSEIYFHPGAERREPDYAALRRTLDESGATLATALTPPPAAR